MFSSFFRPLFRPRSWIIVHCRQSCFSIVFSSSLFYNSLSPFSANFTFYLLCSSVDVLMTRIKNKKCRTFSDSFLSHSKWSETFSCSLVFLCFAFVRIYTKVCVAIPWLVCGPLSPSVFLLCLQMYVCKCILSTADVPKNANYKSVFAVAAVCSPFSFYQACNTEWESTSYVLKEIVVDYWGIHFDWSHTFFFPNRAFSAFSPASD